MTPTYRLIEDQYDDLWNISIVDGPAAGIVFRYTSVRFEPNPTDGKLNIKFHYDVLHNEQLVEPDVLIPIIKQILDDILQKEQSGTN